MPRRNEQTMTAARVLSGRLGVPFSCVGSRVAGRRTCDGALHLTGAEFGDTCAAFHITAV